MKTKVLALAALLFAAGSSVCFAANDNDNKDCKKQATECTKQKKCDKECRKVMNPFEGLNLTAEQQTKLDALKQNCPMKADRQKVDKQDKKDMKSEMMAKRVQCKRDFLAQVKNILTPEQYVQFLENSFVNGQNRHGKMDHHKGKMNFKKDHASKGDAQNRPERGSKGNSSAK
ncbi:MAG: Spy/CpxP family protein refolding chaperone [Muribaculaceae bacterium]|nr:Spy/CpxP family protein refolding chaperone [Muribaculaceae bacterium]